MREYLGRTKGRLKTMSERRYVTIIPVPKEVETEVERLFGSIREGDPTFDWKLKMVEDELCVRIYSVSMGKAKSRGEWVTGNVEILRGQPYRVFRESSVTRPKQVVGLREYSKRKKQWGVK